MFWNWEGLREIFGKAPAWNLRLLPFWMLMLYLLAGLGAAELVRLLSTGRHVGDPRRPRRRSSSLPRTAPTDVPVAGSTSPCPAAVPA